MISPEIMEFPGICISKAFSVRGLIRILARENEREKYDLFIFVIKKVYREVNLVNLIDIDFQIKCINEIGSWEVFRKTGCIVFSVNSDNHKGKKRESFRGFQLITGTFFEIVFTYKFAY